MGLVCAQTPALPQREKCLRTRACAMRAARADVRFSEVGASRSSCLWRLKQPALADVSVLRLHQPVKSVVSSAVTVEVAGQRVPLTAHAVFGLCEAGASPEFGSNNSQAVVGLNCHEVLIRRNDHHAALIRRKRPTKLYD